MMKVERRDAAESRKTTHDAKSSTEDFIEGVNREKR
jgi:hypothetical protein